MAHAEDSPRAAVEVKFSWGSVPQCAEVLADGKPFSLGDVATSARITPPEKLQAFLGTRVTLEGTTYFVDFSRQEDVSVRITRGPTGTLDVVPDVGRIALSVGDAAVFSLEDWSLSVRATSAEPRPRRRVVFAWRTHVWTLASLAVHGLFLLGMFFMPPNAGALNTELDAGQARYIRFQLDAIAREAAELPAPPSPANTADRGGEASRGEEGEAGARDEHRRTGGNTKVRGASSDTRVPMAREQVATAGILGTLRSLGLPTSIASPYGAEDAMGFSEADAYGLTADRDGFSPGTGGLGIRGIGRGGCPVGQVCEARGTVAQNGIHTGGGGCSPDEFARLEQSIGHAAAVERCSGPSHRGPSLSPEHREARVPTLRVVDTQTMGALSAEQIRRTIQRHMSEIRFCYTQALQSRPDLEGRVTARFTISPTGAVASSLVAQGIDPEVDDCVARKISQWSFPAAPGASAVIYPFVFAVQ